MKKLKFGIGLFLAGQLAALFYKDKSFKDKLKEASWMDKLKVMFNWLVDLNKKLFKDISEYDYEWKMHEINSYISDEKEELEWKIDDLKKKLQSLNKDKLQPMLWDIEKKANSFKKVIEETIEDLNDKYDLEEKLSKVMKKIEELKK